MYLREADLEQTTEAKNSKTIEAIEQNYKQLFQNKHF